MIGDRDFRLGLGIVIEVWGLGICIGIGDCHFDFGLGIRIGD